MAAAHQDLIQKGPNMTKGHRDNIAGIEDRSPARTIYLLPGKVIQWFIYMKPSGNYGRVRQSTRSARSPIMTYVFATLFWLFAGFVAALFLYPPSRLVLLDVFRSSGAPK